MNPDGHRRTSRRSDGRPSLGQIGHGLAGGRAGLGANLDLRQEGLVVGPLAGQLDSRENPIRHMREGEALAVDQQQLLLDPDAEGRPAAEAGLLRPPVGGAHGLSPSAVRAAIRPKTSAAARPLA